MEAITKLLEHIGYATPLLWAAAAYGLFYWLDENTSDEAKAAVTGTMQSKGLEADRIVSALLEVFDRIYTYPLWSKRAFRRSMVLTFLACVVTYPAISRLGDAMLASGPADPHPAFILSSAENLVLTAAFVILSMSVNILTDYVSLFYVRRRLSAGIRRPVLALTLGALIATVIVTIGNLIRSIIDVLFVISVFVAKGYLSTLPAGSSTSDSGALASLAKFFSFTFLFSIPALVVFVWLPLLAIGILVARATGPFFWIVGKTQWFLKDGQNHPFKAVGCAAAVVVLICGAILHVLV